LAAATCGSKRSASFCFALTSALSPHAPITDAAAVPADSAAAVRMNTRRDDRMPPTGRDRVCGFAG
jgi:hypothetical protein